MTSPILLLINAALLAFIQHQQPLAGKILPILVSASAFISAIWGIGQLFDKITNTTEEEKEADDV